MKAYKPRRPTRPPTEGDLAERDAFAAMAAESLPSVRSNAEIWRNGLTAFITLVTTGIVISGRDTTSDLDVTWRVIVTLLLGLGLASAVVGLWQTLAAQAGTRSGAVTLAVIHREYGSVGAYKVALAAHAAERMGRARILVAVALGLLLGGVAATWWAPPAPADPPAYLEVTHGGVATCGTLQSADGGQIRLKVAGAEAVVAISQGSVANMRVVASCG